MKRSLSDLQSRLDRLRSRIRYAVWLNGVSWIVVALLGAVLCIGLFDWRVHIDDGLLRLCFGLTVLIGACVLAWRVLIQPLRERFSDVAIALKIEQRYPGFHDSLASTVQFAEQGADPRLGSPVLQQQVVAQTMFRLSDINLGDVVETRGVRRASWIAVAVCLLVALIAGLRPAEASLALQRLLFPYSAGEWPRKTRLHLLDRSLKPMALAQGDAFRRVQGDTFRFYVADRRGRLPHVVTLSLRYGDGETNTEKLRRVTVRDESGAMRDLCVANILVERGPITFRVVGGDDHTMKERTLHVVPAPRLKSLHVSLHPPKYTGRKVLRLSDGVGHFEALVGTRVVILAETNKPLKSAHLRVKNRTVPGLKLSKDGRSLSATFTVRESGNYSYWFEFKDREGFENPQAPRYDVKAISDRVPVVRLVAPAEDIRITAGDQAQGIGTVLLVKPLVEDDLGIRSVALRYRFEHDKKGEYRRKVFYRAPPPVRSRRGKTENRIEFMEAYRWELTDVTEGMQIRFFIESDDEFNLDATGRPDKTGMSRHMGKSLTRTISIVTPAEKTAEIAGNYSALLDDLVRVEKLQRGAHGEVGQLRLQLQKAKRLRPQHDLSLLNRVMQDQRDVARQLVDAKSSIRNRAQRSLDELRTNHLTNPRLQRRLNRILSELDALKLLYLRQVIVELRAVDSSARLPKPAGKKGKSVVTPEVQLRRLKSAEGLQGEILKSLGELIGELSEWRNWQDLSADISNHIGEQQNIQRETELIKRRTLGKPASELTDQEKADLARLAERQRRVADQIKRLQKSIGKFLERLRKQPGVNKPAIETLNDVAGLIRDEQITERIRKSANRIAANRLGAMSKTQKQLVDSLREMNDILENRGADNLETLIKRQKRAEADLATLQKQQEDVLQRLRKLGTSPKSAADRDVLQRLIKIQQSLRKRAAEMSRKLRRLTANRANDSALKAGDDMQRSVESLRRNALAQAKSEQKEAVDRLRQARRDLARARLRMQGLLAAEKLQRLADDIQGLIRRQTNVINETARLKGDFERTQKWTRGRLITLDTQREEQDRLRIRIVELVAGTENASIFAVALKQIVVEMASATKALADSRKNSNQLATALTHARAAKTKLVKLQKTLRPNDHRMTTQPPQADGGGQNGAGELAGPSQVAQLRLLKSLQDDLKARTAELDRQRKKNGKLAPEQAESLETITSQQEQLADLLRDFMRKLGINSSPAAPNSNRKLPPGNSSKTELKSKPIPASNTGAKQTERKTENPVAVLRRAHRRMRAAGRSLARRETAAATQKTQQQVSDDLDKLIRSASQQVANRSPSQSPKKRHGDPNSNTAKTDGPKSSTRKKRGNSGSKSDPKTTKKSGKSSPDIRKSAAAARKLNIARRQKLLREVWGHLPETVKQQLRNMTGENYLPKYKPLINRYFESLAE